MTPSPSTLLEQEKDESLLSDASLYLSLSAPRAPPYDTAQRSLYASKEPSKAALAHHHHHHYHHHNRSQQEVHPSKLKQSKFTHDLLTKVYNNNMHNYNRKAPSSSSSHHQHHPHLSFSPQTSDQITRYMSSSKILPKWYQNKLRDEGKFRSLSDTLVTCSAPSMALFNPKALMNFVSLSSKKHRIQIPYGFHSSQTIDLHLPPGCSSSSGSSTSSSADGDIKGLVFFVHGGAWGSGMPWMYRLVALPFLKENIAVAVVGYRTYPDGNVQDQVDDLHEAAQTLATKYPHLWNCKKECREKKKKNQTINKSGEVKEKENKEEDSNSFGVCLMGHSSGAHIAMLLLIQQIEKQIMTEGTDTDTNANTNTSSKDGMEMQFDSYVGLSGVYNIQHHFDYEAGRGVEEISPMKPACGYSREAFDNYSPAMKLHSLMKICNSNKKGGNADLTMSRAIPPMLLLHGMHDDTVPFTSTSEAARIIKSCGARHCSEYYISKIGHVDVIMDFMLGGRSGNVVMRWLEEIASSDDGSPGTQPNIGLSSKL